MAPKLPSNARRTADEQEVYRRLAKFHGIDDTTARHRLHVIKKKSGRAPNDDVLFDLTGGVYDPVSLDLLGSMTEGNS